MSEAESEPWTKEEFDDFNVVNRWTFDESKTEIAAYLFNKDGAALLPDYDLRGFLDFKDVNRPSIKIYLTTGTTGSSTPVQVTQDDFSFWNKMVGVPKRLLKTRANSDDMGFLEYLIERDEEGISAVNFLCDWAPYGNVYIWFIARVDVRSNTVDCLVSSKNPLDHDELMGLLTDSHDMLLDEPLHFIGLLFTAAAKWCRTRIQSNVRDLLEIEAEIGVTSDIDYLRSRGYRLDNDDFEDINARLFGEAKSIATHRVYINHLKDFGSTLLDVVHTVRKQKNRTLSDTDGPWLGREDRGTYELEYLERRLRPVSHNLDYCHTVAETLFQVLYNRMLQRDARLSYRVARAAKQDSTAMKTISILTLTFLPMTAVSAVFSGTVFDFGNWGVPGQRVASGGWWVFLLSCVLSTIVTVGVWWAWLYKSEKKLDWEERKDKQEAEDSEDDSSEEEKEVEAKENDESDEKKSVKSKGSNPPGFSLKSRRTTMKSNRSYPAGFSLRSRKSTRLSASQVV